MHIIVTGTPGTGKTTIAKALAHKLKLHYLNEHDFCARNKIGKIDWKTGELVVPIPALQKALQKLLKKEKSLVLEGHLLCEARLPVDLAIVITCNEKLLERRLKKKHYSDEKLLENLHCESIKYCKYRALKNYGKKKVLRMDNSKGIKKTLPLIIKALKKIQQENQ